MKTNETSKALMARAIAKAKEASFVRGGYTVAIECSLAEYAKEFDVRYKHADVNTPAEVFAVETKEGNTFLKVLFHVTKGDELEMKLSKKSDLEEDDLIDPSTLRFMFLEKGDKCDWVCDGDLYEEPKP